MSRLLFCITTTLLLSNTLAQEIELITTYDGEDEVVSTIEATVSLNFKGAKLIDILRLLAVQNNLNIIAGQDVEGEITVTLTDVNLGTALEAILKVNGHDWFFQDNIIVVKPVEREMMGELLTRIYKLEYVDASVVSNALENVLSPKGKVQVFSPVMKSGMGGIGGAPGRGGTAGPGGAGSMTPGTTTRGLGGMGALGIPSPDHLVVTDVHSNFPAIEEVIYNLDKQIPQINIAIKFIETKLATDERLGINWDLRSTLSGPTVEATEADETETAAPITLGFGRWNSLRIATLSLPVFSALMEILSTDTDTKLLQEPQITTFDNTLATVSVGTTIPILVPQPEGGLIGIQPFTFQDEEIDITLSVQPRINEGRFISMTINSTVEALVGYAGPNADRPIISDRSTQTQVMVTDGETLLIGGLIFDSLIETETKVPILGSIPVIRKFFSHKSTSSEQRELLIFITPNIVKHF